MNADKLILMIQELKINDLKAHMIKLLAEEVAKDFRIVQERVNIFLEECITIFKKFRHLYQSNVSFLEKSPYDIYQFLSYERSVDDFLNIIPYIISKLILWNKKEGIYITDEQLVKYLSIINHLNDAIVLSPYKNMLKNQRQFYYEDAGRKKKHNFATKVRKKIRTHLFSAFEKYCGGDKELRDEREDNLCLAEWVFDWGEYVDAELEACMNHTPISEANPMDKSLSEWLSHQPYKSESDSDSSISSEYYSSSSEISHSSSESIESTKSTKS